MSILTPQTYCFNKFYQKIVVKLKHTAEGKIRLSWVLCAQFLTLVTQSRTISSEHGPIG